MMVLNIEKSECIVLTQTPIKIKNKLFLEIPDKIVNIMELNEKSLLETLISKVENRDKEFE